MALFKDIRLLALSLVAIVLCGVVSFHALPRMEDPIITERAGIINTRLPGSDARRIESLVTEKITKKIREFDEVKEIRSTSRADISTVVVTLKDEVSDVDEIWARVRDKLNDVTPQLPPDAGNPELEIIRVRAFAAIYGLTWKGSEEPVYSVLCRIARELEEEIRNIPNTEKVELFGKPEEEIVLEVRQSELAKMGLTVEDLSRQIQSSDVKTPAGLLRGARQDFQIEVGGEFDSLARISRIPIQSQRNGLTSYISDIAEIRKGRVQPARSEAIVDADEAIMIAVSVLPDARIDQWNQILNDRIALFKSSLPPDLELSTIFEQNKYVDARINYLVRDLFLSAFAVFAVVFLMMGWRSSCIVGLALPLSSCIVFATFRIFGIPLHQMSLSGLVIALGMLEGTAIIIVDEVQHRIRAGEGRYHAFKNSVSHMALPLFGSTATTVLSFLPIAIMPGPSGEFVGTIGMSVVVALCASLLLSFTIIPALSALFSKRDEGRLTFWNNGFSSQRLSNFYQFSLEYFLMRPVRTGLLGILLSVPGFIAVVIMPIQFFPSADRDQFYVEIELSPQASLSETREIALQVRKLILEEPVIRRVDLMLGRNAPSFYYNMIGTTLDSPRFAEALVQTRTTTNLVGLISRLQKRLDASVPTAQVRVRQLEQGPPFDAPIELRILGNNEEDIREYGELIRQMLRQHPSVIQTQADLTDRLPKLVYNINEEHARLVGMPLSSIANQLQNTLEGSVGGSIIEGSEEIPVRVRVAREQRNNVASIEGIDLLADINDSKRRSVTLSSLGSGSLQAESASINRFNGVRMNEVRAFLEAGVIPSTVLDTIQIELKKPEFAPPTGCVIEFGGENSKRSEALGQLLGNVSMLAAGIVFVLVFSLRSFRAMAIILFVGILSFGLAALSLWSTGLAFGFTAIVGAMGMIGIAINDSIVVLAELRFDPFAKYGDLNRILEIVKRSTRHVLCTTFTVGCSFIPMLMEGGTFWPPMAVIIIGGVFGATILALYWIPAIHILVCGRNQVR